MYRKQARRRRAVLALLVVSSFALLTATYGDSSGGLQRSVSAIFGPLEEGADRALKPARDLVNWFDETFEARGENERLQAELDAMTERAAAGQAAQAQVDQLRELLRFTRDPRFPAGFDGVGARVIGRSPTVWFSTVTIDKGSSAGIAIDDPVISPSGLVGRVTSVTGGQAKVTLITDPTSAVSATVVPDGVQGVISPEVGDPDSLVLDFIDSARPVDEGQLVVTAGWSGEGISSHFPYGIAIGSVTEASIAQQEASQQVRLRPFADLRDLDLVEVLTGGGR